MERLPPLLPMPPASLNNLRGTDAIVCRAPKRHRPLEPRPASSGSRRREPNPPPSSWRRAGRPPPPPSKVRRRARSPPYVSTTLRLAELQRARRPSADAPVDGLEEGEIARPSSLDASFVEKENRPSHSHCNCKHPETSSAAVEKRPDHVFRGREQEWHSEKMDGKNQSGGGWKKGNSFIKPSMKSKLRYCYNCKEPGHFANDCPYEMRDEKPNYVKKDATPKLLPNPINAKRPSADVAVDGLEEGEIARPSSLDATFVKKGNSFIDPRMKIRRRYCYNCKDPGHFANDCPYEDKPNYVKKDAMPKLLPNPLNKKKNLKGRDGKAFIGATYMSGDEEGDEKEENVVGVANLAMARPGSNFEYDHKATSGSAHRKKMKRQRWAEAQKEMREMKKDKLLEKIKKLQACVWLLEKDGADMAEIMKFWSLLESTKKQYVENEAQLAQQVSSASQQVLKKDRLEKMHVETMAAPVEKKAEGDEQNMDSGKVEGRSLKGCKAVSEQNELAEEVNCLKSELETVKRDRDYQLAQAQSVMADVAKQKEVARRYGVELEDAMRRIAALQEGCQLQLASSNEKLTVPSS